MEDIQRQEEKNRAEIPCPLGLDYKKRLVIFLGIEGLEVAPLRLKVQFRHRRKSHKNFLGVCKQNPP